MAGNTPLFGFLDKIKEAVGATKELLYDAELRRRAVPFVLSEGGKALQELQKGLSRNAAAIGRQLQHGASGQGFAVYISRLLERAAAQPNRARIAGKYAADQPVSVWLGTRVLHGAPQQLRSRLWFVALEHPELLTQLGPICSPRLLRSPSMTSVPDATPPNILDDDGTGLLGTPHPAVATVAPSTAASPAAAAAAGALEQQTSTTDQQLQQGGQLLLLDLEDKQPPQPAVATAQPIQPTAAGQLEDPLAALFETNAQATSSNSAAHAGDNRDETGAVVRLAAAHGDNSLTAPLIPETDPSLPSVDSGHAAEDDVLQMLEHARSVKAAATAAAFAPQPPQLSASKRIMSGLLNKVASAVDKGRETMRRTSSSAHAAGDDALAHPTPFAGDTLPARSGSVASSIAGVASSGGSHSGAVFVPPGAVQGAVKPAAGSQKAISPEPHQQQQHQQQQGGDIPTPSALSGTDAEWEWLETSVHGSGSNSSPDKQGGSPGPGAGAAAGVAGAGGSSAAGAAGSDSHNYTAVCQQLLHHIILEAQAQASSSGTGKAHSQAQALVQLATLMQAVQWEHGPAATQGQPTEGHGSHTGYGGGGRLVCDLPEDCRYLTLNEMTAGQEEVDDVITRDINRTFPEHPMFSRDEGQQALFRLLKAYSLHDLEVGYCQGMAFSAGVLLMYLPEEPAFRLYCVLMGDEGANLRRLYLPGLDHLKQQLHRFEQLLAVTQPALQAHLEAYGIPPVLYASQWIMTTYACPFAPSFCAQVLDIMAQDRHDAVLLRVGLCVMDALASDLLQLHDFEALLTTIKATPADWDEDQLARVLSQAVSKQWTSDRATALLLGPNSTGNPAADMAALLPVSSTEALAELVLENGGNMDAMIQLESSGRSGGFGAGGFVGEGNRSGRLHSRGSSLGRLLSMGSGTHAAAAGAGVMHTTAGAGAGVGGEDDGSILAAFAAGGGGTPGGSAMSAEDLQLDHEIAQMVLDLKLRMPAGAHAAQQQQQQHQQVPPDLL